MKPKYLQLDTLDDRREIHHMLEKLPPAKRIAWLSWCCQQVTLPNSTLHPRVAKKTMGLAIEIYYDAWMMAVSFGLDMDRAAVKLTEMVRKAR